MATQETRDECKEGYLILLSRDDHVLMVVQIIRRLKMKIRKDVASYEAAVASGNANAPNVYKKGADKDKHKYRLGCCWNALETAYCSRSADADGTCSPPTFSNCPRVRTSGLWPRTQRCPSRSRNLKEMGPHRKYVPLCFAEGDAI